MNYKEACTILGVDPKASEAAIRKQFKAQAAANHPDKNPANLQKSKEISEAFNFIKDQGFKEPVPKASFPWENIRTYSNGSATYTTGFKTPFDPYHDPFADFFNSYRSHPTTEDINIDIQVSFKDAILGSTQEVELEREEKCATCSPDQKEACPDCNPEKTAFNKGTKKVKKKYNVKVPPGSANGTLTFRLNGAGHYSHQFQQYANAFVHVKVKRDPKFILEGVNIISFEKITLLQALRGDIVEWETVHGKVKVVIPPLARHLDNLVISGKGIPNKGAHVFKLEVEYPADKVKEIISILEKE
jgi:molecular chaperone DnaJ